MLDSRNSYMMRVLFPIFFLTLLTLKASYMEGHARQPQQCVDQPTHPPFLLTLGSPYTLTLNQKSHITTIILGQLDQIRLQSLRCLIHKLL